MTVPPIEQILSLLLSKNTIMLQQLIFHSSQLGGDGRLKTKENFKIFAPKVVTVAYERWSRTRGSKYSDLTWKILELWKTGYLREVVAAGGSTLFHILIYLNRFHSKT